MKVIKLPLIFLLVFSSTVFAQTRAEKRMEHQEQRIANGIESGSINEKEADRLESGQERVQKQVSKAMEDGELSRGEKRHINRMQNHQSHKIRKEKH